MRTTVKVFCISLLKCALLSMRVCLSSLFIASRSSFSISSNKSIILHYGFPLCSLTCTYFYQGYLTFQFITCPKLLTLPIANRRFILLWVHFKLCTYTMSVVPWFNNNRAERPLQKRLTLLVSHFDMKETFIKCRSVNSLTHHPASNHNSLHFLSLMFFERLGGAYLKSFLSLIYSSTVYFVCQLQKTTHYRRSSRSLWPYLLLQLLARYYWWCKFFCLLNVYR